MKHMPMSYATAASQKAVTDEPMAGVDALMKEPGERATRRPDARPCAVKVRPIIGGVPA
ncbi:hypothetical protein [Nonomuraea sp. NPDC050643]|uniref:hypothetical protein n=1 Tax=Nonomuraea sp. NPDC050643 TaxID=3155660 RepID=UPI0033C86D87